MPSKFTADRRTRFLDAKKIGASTRTAAKVAGIGHQTALRWLEKGKEAAEGTAYHNFFEAVQEAEAQLPMRALGIIWNELPDKPDLAWKVVERREPGYAPPMPAAPSQLAGPVLIQLAFSSRNPLQLAAAEVIEGEVVDESDLQPESTPSTA